MSKEILICLAIHKEGGLPSSEVDHRDGKLLAGGRVVQFVMQTDRHLPSAICQTDRQTDIQTDTPHRHPQQSNWPQVLEKTGEMIKSL